MTPTVALALWQRDVKSSIYDSRRQCSHKLGSNTALVVLLRHCYKALLNHYLFLVALNKQHIN